MKKKMLRVCSIALAVSFGLASIVLSSPLSGHAAGTPSPNKDATPIQKVQGSKLLSNLQNKISKVNHSEKLPVIITFKNLQQTSNLQASKAKVPSLKAKHLYKNIPAIATELTKSEINALTALPEVVQIEYDEPIQSFSSTANHWYGTQKARTDFGVTGDRDGSLNSYSKSDVTIAVIDTGIDASHVDLDGGKVIGWKDFVNNRSTPYDDQGHGTHVAGIAAGAGDGNSSYVGVAPGAALVGVKVLDSRGSGSMSNVTAGIDWCISNKSTYGIDVINMSLGTSGSSDGSDATSLATNRAADAGIVVAVAAGNSGPSTKTIGSPGAAEKALTVGAMADPGEKGFNLASFSSRGTTADGRIKPDISAPGVNIMAAKANSGNGYVSYSGTSMATPFTAGAVALMLDANPNLTPDQVKSTLASTATDFGPAGKDVDYGSGNLKGYDAVKAAGGYTGEGPALPAHMKAQGTIGGSGLKDEYTFQLDATSTPIAITMIMPNWSWFQDYDLYLFDPSGVQVASSTSSSRQETINFTPTVTGQYTIRVHSYLGFGSGNYFFDLSANGSGLTQTVNQ
ncbi:S8 family serine peptidase [Hazenella coriacea]|uniref:Serine protease AprX n=1 Tax=Hazenella coriacea TaxID=1179467 RepID=A0A4R3L6S8_9BACL|nr:S8 family serine peptidase [Hazenella coriacea]TCS94735.1 serine protease AprX [Hazenella coriacea]